MKTKIFAVILAVILAFSCTACDSKKDTSDSTDNVLNRANTQKTTDTEKSTVTDVARATDIETETDVYTTSDIITDTENTDNTEDTELIETEIDNETLQPQAIDLAGYTLSAEQVEMDKGFTAVSSDRITGEMLGDTLYILDKNKMYGYYISGASAEKSSEIKLNSDYTKIDADSSGTVYLSGDTLNAAYLAENGEIYETEISGKLALSDITDFGLVYSKKSDNVLKYSDSNTETWALTNMHDNDTRKGDFNMISNIEIVGDRVFVTGSSADENNARKLGVYSTDGELIMLSDDKTSGTGIVSLTNTENGYMACSHGTLALWNFDGSLAGISTSGELAKLFGTSDTITLNKLFSLNDGAVLALCTIETDGKTQPVLYRIMGF